MPLREIIYSPLRTGSCSNAETFVGNATPSLWICKCEYLLRINSIKWTTHFRNFDIIDKILIFFLKLLLITLTYIKLRNLACCIIIVLYVNYCRAIKLFYLCKLLSSNYVFYVNYLQIRFLPVRIIFIIIIIFEYVDAPNLIPFIFFISQ